uniref:Uncharacterized protein n=1 Tax=Lepeophtheirus salmonis TaxID=72036 RepID=A0A0K2U683_LEPSM
MKEKSKDPILRAVFKCIFSVFQSSPSHPTCGLSGPESSCTGFFVFQVQVLMLRIHGKIINAVSSMARYPFSQVLPSFLTVLVYFWTPLTL